MTIVWPISSTARCMNARTSPPACEVEVAGRLVGEDDLRAARQRAGDGDALLLAAGELGRAVLEPVAEADGVDDVVEPLLVGLASGERQRECDVLDRVQGRNQVVRLEDEADLVAAHLRELLLVQSGELDVAEEHLPRCERVESGDAMQQSRLAGTRRAHDRGVRPALEVDIDIVEGAHLGLARAVNLARVDRRGPRPPSWGDSRSLAVPPARSAATLRKEHGRCYPEEP